MAQKCPTCGHKAYLGFTAIECENPVCMHFKMPPLVVERTYASYTPGKAMMPPTNLVPSTPRWISLHACAPINFVNEGYGGGYKRVEIDQGQVMDLSIVNVGGLVYHQINNNRWIDFPACMSGGGVISHFGYWERISFGDVLIASGSVGTPAIINVGDVPRFAPQSIFIELP